MRHADLVLRNVAVSIRSEVQSPPAAIAVRAGRILAIGTETELSDLVGPTSAIVDGGGGLALPGFHDAHLHLFSYARSLSTLHCDDMRSIREIQAAIAEYAKRLPPGTWVRVTGYDETHLVEKRHPDRYDLDAATESHPVRLQHRALHVNILNTRALAEAGLLSANAPSLERDPATGEPTGRVYHGAEFLRGRLPHRSVSHLAGEVRSATERLLSFGVTSVQDASVTNGPEEWELYHSLAARGDLRVRVFMLPGGRYWRAVVTARPPTDMVRLGPIKFVVNEAHTDPDELKREVVEAHSTGRTVALHATSDAELVLALEALRGAVTTKTHSPDRIEHAFVVPDALLNELKDVRAMVVGQPSLVFARGDVYCDAYPSSQHDWLHRARSFVQIGIPYAIGSDAPIVDPCPGLAIAAATSRQTRAGAVLGVREKLDLGQAIRAYTCAPASAVGVQHELGGLQPGMKADIVVLDRNVWAALSHDASAWPVRLTMVNGAVAWQCPARASG